MSDPLEAARGVKKVKVKVQDVLNLKILWLFRLADAIICSMESKYNEEL